MKWSSNNHIMFKRKAIFFFTYQGNNTLKYISILQKNRNKNFKQTLSSVLSNMGCLNRVPSF